MSIDQVRGVLRLAIAEIRIAMQESPARDGCNHEVGICRCHRRSVVQRLEQLRDELNDDHILKLLHDLREYIK